MNNGWIKLHRKLNDNNLMRDANALQIFIWLLLNVDKETGTIKIGRKWLSSYLKQNPNTFYGSLRRLRDTFKIVETTTIDNNQSTLVRLLNWDNYQSKEVKTTTPKNNSSRLRQVSRNTLQEERIENKNNTGKSPEIKTNKDWQEKALQAESFLKVKIPDTYKSRWFKFFREVKGTDNAKNLSRALGYVVDHPNAHTPEQKILLFLSLAQKGFQQV